MAFDYKKEYKEFYLPKHKHIPNEAVAMLREQGLAEGREPDKRGEVLPLE